MVATSGEGQEMNQPSAVVNYYTSFSTKAYIAIVSLIVGSLLLFLFRGKAIALMKKYHSQWNDIKENPANLQLRYRLLLIVCTMMYGSNYVTTKYMQRRLAPSLTTTLRFFIASLFFLPEVLRYKGDAMLIYIGCEIGFYCAVAFCVQAVTLQLTSASKNAFLSSLAVVLIPMLDILYTNMFAPMVVPPGAPATAGGSHPLPHASTPALHAEGGTMRTFSTPRQQLLGAPLILTSRARANSCCSDEEAGGGEVERTGEQAALLEPSPVKVGALLTLPATPGPGVAIAGGKILTVFVPSLMSIMGVAVLELGGVDPPKAVDLLVCVVPVAFAFCYWRSEHASEQFPDDIPVLTGVYLSASCFFCLMFTFLQGEFPLTLKSDSALAVILLDWKIFVPLLYTGVITTAWTALVEQQAIRTLSATEVSVIYTLEPLFATLLSSVVLGEEFGIQTVFGAIFIVGACLWRPVILPRLDTEACTGVCGRTPTGTPTAASGGAQQKGLVMGGVAVAWTALLRVLEFFIPVAFASYGEGHQHQAHERL